MHSLLHYLILFHNLWLLCIFNICACSVTQQSLTIFMYGSPYIIFKFVLIIDYQNVHSCFIIFHHYLLFICIVKDFCCKSLQLYFSPFAPYIDSQLFLPSPFCLFSAPTAHALGCPVCASTLVNFSMCQHLHSFFEPLEYFCSAHTHCHCHACTLLSVIPSCCCKSCLKIIQEIYCICSAVFLVNMSSKSKKGQFFSLADLFFWYLYAIRMCWTSILVDL